MDIKAYAAKSAKSQLEPFTYEANTLQARDVEIKISHCGICHSDVHLVDNDWDISTYPLVPGHEIVGTVTDKGEAVVGLDIGQRVGVGWQRNSCLHCEFCIRGDENLCAQNEAVCVGNYGGFAEVIRLPEHFVFPVPDELSSVNVAPLLCGGITVFSPLKHFNISPNANVGVIGIGGLGHLALQFAANWGCEVTAFSTRADKEKEAVGFGAHHFVVSTDQKQMEDQLGRYDIILNTAHANLDWGSWVNLLRPDGTLCFLGVPSEPLSIPVFNLLGGRKRVAASPIGSRTDIRDMLEFAARHGVAAKTETAPLSEVNSAFDRVRKNEARYRMVLTT